MFFKTQTDNLSMAKDERRETIKLLIRIRNSKNPTLESNQISSPEKQLIQAFALMIGCKLILSEQKASSDNLDKFLKLKSSFNEVLTLLASRRHSFPLVQYASDLLQFYVFTCNKDAAHLQDIMEIMEFLGSRIETLGDTSNNLFIQEYLLINIYNKLIIIQEDFEQDKISKADVEEKLVEITEKLGGLREKLNDMASKNPYNVFIHYLSFSANYSASKLLEIQYQVNSDTYDESYCQIWCMPIRRPLCLTAH